MFLSCGFYVQHGVFMWGELGSVAPDQVTDLFPDTRQLAERHDFDLWEIAGQSPKTSTGLTEAISFGCRRLTNKANE